MNRIEKKKTMYLNMKYLIWRGHIPIRGSFLQNSIVFPAKILEVTLLEGIFLQKSFVIPAKILLTRGINIPGKGSQKIRRNDIDT